MVEVEVTKHLFTFFPQLRDRELRVEASTVAEVVAAIEEIAPGFLFYICDERGALRQHVNVFIGEERIVDRARLSDRVAPGVRVLVMQALSGG
ncbi:MAG: MoaD/ThiS family protein [Sandaracinaceae bacterium]